jgi:alkanesulfonate monooxygenase SsuD/methylene tetrahydromethanopterin reductase-like flavin-dependent oxidoreductase (luciferase family)
MAMTVLLVHNLPAALHFRAYNTPMFPAGTTPEGERVTRMEIGIGLPTRTGDAPLPILLEIAARAEEGPFSSLAVADRVIFPAAEPLVSLAAVIGVTRRIRLLTSAVLGPTRETTLLARQAATIDALSGGRLSLGLGVGVRADDYAATGSEFGTRGRRLEEQLAELRRIWAEGSVGPGPVRPGGPEILIGGYVDAVARRIAAWGDGFIAPGGGEPARMVELWSRIQAAWASAGRPGKPRLVGAAYYALGRNAGEAANNHISAWYGFDPALAERRLAGIATTPEAVRAAIERQREMGADEFILRPCVADLEQVDLLADLVDGLSG